MSRHAALSPRARRGWAIGLVAFFVLLCFMIGLSQWWAIHVNVPRYERQTHAAGKPR